MKLTKKELASICHGALRVEENEQGEVCFYRFSKKGQAYYDTVENHRCKAYATSSVRLEFDTDSASLSLEYYATCGSSRRFCYLDVFVDGVMVKHFGHDELDEVASTLSLDLGAGKHRVAIYFPNLFALRVRSLTLDDGASLEPVQKSRRLLLVGDSITQGYDARFPSQSYANLLSDKLDASPVNQAIGGEIFCPQILFDDLDFDPDLIIVAYGSNDWSRCRREELLQNATLFFERLRHSYPGAKIFAVTPIWRADDHRTTGVGSFADAVRIITSAAQAQPGIVVLHGTGMTPHIPDFFSDGYLHPNDAGFKFYARALIREILPHLEAKE